MTLRRRRFRPGHRLAHLEAFELRMLQIERAGRLVARTRMRHPKRLRLGPSLEGGLALPDRMRGVERVVLSLRALEQMELDKARNLMELRVAIEPDALEGILRSALYTKAIHGDEHGTLLLPGYIQPGTWLSCCSKIQRHCEALRLAIGRRWERRGAAHHSKDFMVEHRSAAALREPHRGDAAAAGDRERHRSGPGRPIAARSGLVATQVSGHQAIVIRERRNSRSTRTAGRDFRFTRLRRLLLLRLSWPHPFLLLAPHRKSRLRIRRCLARQHRWNFCLRCLDHCHDLLLLRLSLWLVLRLWFLLKLFGLLDRLLLGNLGSRLLGLYLARVGDRLLLDGLLVGLNVIDLTRIGLVRAEGGCSTCGPVVADHDVDRDRLDADALQGLWLLPERVERSAVDDQRTKDQHAVQPRSAGRQHGRRPVLRADDHWRRARVTAPRSRKCNHVAKIGRRASRSTKQPIEQPVTRRDRGNALEVGDIAAVRTSGDEVGGVNHPSRHPRLKNSSPNRTLSEPLNVIPAPGVGIWVVVPPADSVRVSRKRV